MALDDDQTLVTGRREPSRIERKLSGQASTGSAPGAILVDGPAAGGAGA